MAEIDSRDDGIVEVIEVKLNNRKTKKLGEDSKDTKKENNKIKVIEEKLRTKW